MTAAAQAMPANFSVRRRPIDHGSQDSEDSAMRAGASLSEPMAHVLGVIKDHPARVKAKEEVR